MGSGLSADLHPTEGTIHNSLRIPSYHCVVQVPHHPHTSRWALDVVVDLGRSREVFAEVVARFAFQQVVSESTRPW